MIAPDALYTCFVNQGISMFAGVPDSLLKDFCAYVTEHSPAERHIITANEGGAVGVAAGHYLATGEHSLVYMQNSGLGNAVNPLLSLADREVYSIPMLLMIGWRGEPGVRDEPQHVKQGRATLELLDVMGIPYVLMDAHSDWKQSVSEAIRTMRDTSAPVALVVRKGTFESYRLEADRDPSGGLTRERAIELLLDNVSGSEVVVATTGMASRELFELRVARGEGHGRDFLTVGSMGHSSQIALGIAISRPERSVVCLDGDGSVLMHSGALAIIGQLAPSNFKHVLINNGAHDSVGGQPTAGDMVDFLGLAKACGYQFVINAGDEEAVTSSLKQLQRVSGPALLEIKVGKGARGDLGRPTSSPVQNRDEFMKGLAR